jgi:hypothetical protein
MAGAIATVYAIAAIAAAILGLLFVVFATGERERELLVGGAIGIALLIGLGATLVL